VKSQVDFIESRFKGKEVKAEVIVHQHCGEAGAIGCAFEAVRLWENGNKSEFIGLPGVASISFTTTRNEATRCYFCKNKCLRTFIDVKTVSPNPNYKPPSKTMAPAWPQPDSDLAAAVTASSIRPTATSLISPKPAPSSRIF